MKRPAQRWRTSAFQRNYDIKTYRYLAGNPTAHTVTRYRKVATQGVAAAQGNLTMYLRGYHNGKGVPQGFAEALHWLQLAAEQGVENALKNLDGIQQLTPGTAVTAALLTCSWPQAQKQPRHNGHTCGRKRLQARPGCGAVRGCSNPNFVQADEPSCAAESGLGVSTDVYMFNLLFF